MCLSGRPYAPPREQNSKKLPFFVFVFVLFFEVYFLVVAWLLKDVFGS